jgi:hypothetical protein
MIRSGTVRHGAQRCEDLLAGAVERGVGQLFQQQVGLAIQHAMPLLDGRLAERLGEVALARTRRTDE